MSRYIERRIARQCATDLIKAGYLVTVHDGEEMTLIDSRSVKEILAAMFTVDEEKLLVRKTANSRTFDGWVFFVYGNNGPDVINDYTTNLEPALVKTNALADRLA